MILPTKKLAAENALLTLGGEILRLLNEPKTVSRLWTELKAVRLAAGTPEVTYDWFVLGLDLLFVLEAVSFVDGRLSRREQ